MIFALKLKRRKKEEGVLLVLPVCPCQYDTMKDKEVDVPVCKEAAGSVPTSL